MLRLSAGQVESLWDEVLPDGVRALSEDLQALDLLLSDPGLLAPISASWQRQALAHGRPTISMQSYVRLLVVKHRTGWGYETLMREVSDSLHLRRFCLIALGERVPDESTVRKLTRRLGAAVVNEITRAVIEKTRREKRFRPRAARIDSTVVEADVRYPTDSGLALDSARVLAREARKLLAKVGKDAGHVRDRSRAIGRRVRAMTRTLGRRTGERKQQVLEFTEQAGKLVERSIGEAKRLVVVARRRARGRARRRSCGRSASWRRSSSAPSRSASRSRSGCAGSGSPIGWCRSSIRTPGRSARASSASRTSSGSWRRSAS
jgi:IS5 family transposase